MVMGLRRLIKNFIYRKKFDPSKNKKITNSIKNQIILVTGANSGIGLALTKKFLNLNNTVIATYNLNNENLLKLKCKNLKIYQCDQSDIKNFNRLEDYIKNISINIIINNAGVWGGKNQNFNNLQYHLMIHPDYNRPTAQFYFHSDYILPLFFAHYHTN